jgi:hypothetical protein
MQFGNTRRGNRVSIPTRRDSGWADSLDPSLALETKGVTTMRGMRAILTAHRLPPGGTDFMGPNQVLPIKLHHYQLKRHLV